MNDYGTPVGRDAVRFERQLPGPVERVWAYLTQSDMRGRWLASGDMEPRLDGRVELHFHHADLTPVGEETPERYKQYEKGVITFGRLTRWEPPRLLAFEWGEPQGDPPAVSEVTFELMPRGDEVLLVLTHRRLPSREEVANVSSGWHTHLGVLEAQLQGRAPGPFWATLTRVEAEYARRFGTGGGERDEKR